MSERTKARILVGKLIALATDKGAARGEADAKGRMFPVLRGYGRTPDERDAWRRCRINVPWAMLAPHERRARLNVCA